MAQFPWGNVTRLDDGVQNTNDIVLYCNNQQVLTTQRGVSLSWLKLIYSCEPNSGFNGSLVGVRPRGTVQKAVITLDSAILDKDEYDLITQDPFTAFPNGLLNYPLPPPRVFPTEQSFLNQINNAYNINQSVFQLSASIPPPSSQLFSQLLPSVLNQSVQSLPGFAACIPRPASSMLDSFATAVSDVPAVSLPPSSAINTSVSVTYTNGAKATDGLDRDTRSYQVRSVTKPSEPSETDSSITATELPGTGLGQDQRVTEERCIDTAQYPYQCDVCHIPFMSKSKFMHHQRRHTEENPYLCTYCGESFRRFDELSKHRNELHLCNKTFRCGQCPKSFSSKKELETHMWRHTGEKLYKCDVCGKQYATAGNLTLHKKQHNGVKQFKCPMCPKTFSYKTVLDNHIRSGHTGEKPFVCSICKKAFPNSSQLSSHEKCHSDLKPYACKVCGKEFRQSHLRKRHERLHSDKRPYKCHVCSKTFRDARNLKYHVTTHQNKAERVVVCPFCGKRVIAGRGILRHLRIQHADKSSTEGGVEKIADSLKPDKEKTDDHVEIGAEGQGNLPCSKCSKKFTTLSGLKMHVLSEYSSRELSTKDVKSLPASTSDPASTPDPASCRLQNNYLIAHENQNSSPEVCKDKLKLLDDNQNSNTIQNNPPKPHPEPRLDLAMKQVKGKRKNCKQPGKVFQRLSKMKSPVDEDHGKENGSKIDGCGGCCRELNSQKSQSVPDCTNTEEQCYETSESKISAEKSCCETSSQYKNSTSSCTDKDLGLSKNSNSRVVGDPCYKDECKEKHPSPKLPCKETEKACIPKPVCIDDESFSQIDSQTKPLSNDLSSENAEIVYKNKCKGNGSDEGNTRKMQISSSMGSSELPVVDSSMPNCNKITKEDNSKEKSLSEEIVSAINKVNSESKIQSIRKSPSSHSKQKKPLLSCTLCRRKFCSVKTLANHMALSHKEIKTILIDSSPKKLATNIPRKKCPHCVMSFVYDTTLERHIGKLHSHLMHKMRAQNSESHENKQESNHRAGAFSQQVDMNKKVEDSTNQFMNLPQRQCIASTEDRSIEKTNDSKANALQIHCSSSEFAAGLGRNEDESRLQNHVAIGKIEVEAGSIASINGQVNFKELSHAQNLVVIGKTGVEAESITASSNNNVTNKEESQFQNNSAINKTGLEAETTESNDNALRDVRENPGNLISMSKVVVDAKTASNASAFGEMVAEVSIEDTTAIEVESTVQLDDELTYSNQSNPSICNKSEAKDCSFQIISSTFDVISNKDISNISKINSSNSSSSITKYHEEPDPIVTSATVVKVNDDLHNIHQENTCKNIGENKDVELPIITTSEFLDLHVGDLKNSSVSTNEFPIVKPSKLMKPPPPGYSYAYLPVLVPNNEETC